VHESRARDHAGSGRFQQWLEVQTVNSFRSVKSRADQIGPCGLAMQAAKVAPFAAVIAPKSEESPQAILPVNKAHC
jgi:hypothetical protein